jgi:hypothetical protein
MTAPATKEYKASDLVALIRRRYAAASEQYNRSVVLEQVPNGTGTLQGRWIDVTVFEMWPSKGLTRSAFEVKISRSDFLRELQSPEKHKWCTESFHEFWFVAPKDVIQLAEIPAGIGWLYPRGDRLCIARHPLRNPNPALTDALLAAFMRAAQKEIEKANDLTERDILAKSTEYKHTGFYRDAVSRFLHERGIAPPYDVTAEDIYDKLIAATYDKQIKQDCHQLLEISGQFQHSIASLATLFLVIAKRALLARNEMGDYIVKSYGQHDDEAVEVLKELSKDPKVSDYQKRYAQTIELLLNWEALNS